MYWWHGMGHHSISLLLCGLLFSICEATKNRKKKANTKTTKNVFFTFLQLPAQCFFCFFFNRHSNMVFFMIFFFSFFFCMLFSFYLHFTPTLLKTVLHVLIYIKIKIVIWVCDRKELWNALYVLYMDKNHRKYSCSNEREWK